MVKWESKLVGSAYTLFRDDDKKDIWTFKESVIDETGYDQRLNLAYCLYLIDKLYVKTLKPKHENRFIKNDLDELGFYCSKTNLAIGLYANGYDLNKVNVKSKYYWTVNIKPFWSNISKSINREKCLLQMEEIVENILIMSGKNKKCGTKFCVEEFVWIENNQIVTDVLMDFSNVNQLQKSLNMAA